LVRVMATFRGGVPEPRPNQILQNVNRDRTKFRLIKTKCKPIFPFLKPLSNRF